MREEITRSFKHIATLHEEINKHQQFIAACRAVCGHEWEDAHDLYDYHKNLARDRCMICGKVR